MHAHCPRLLALGFFLNGLAALAQGPVLPPGEKEPLLRLEAGGPTSFVTSVAFSNDGKTFYAAGFDKVVRVWVLDEQKSAFVLDRVAYRVPIGPGLDGAINAIALSSDGAWLAAAGRGVFRGSAGFRQPGLLVPPSALTDEMWRDQGTIYVFNTRTQEVKLLRGHLGAVLSLAFAPAGAGKPPLLLSAARERGARPEEAVGAVRLWDVGQGVELERRQNLPDPRAQRPGLALWQTGPQPRQARAALAWGDGVFRLWDVADGKLWESADGVFNTTVAYLAAQDQVLAGSRRPAAGGQPGFGQLNLWSVPAGKEPQVAGRVTFPTAGDANFFPWALALASSQSNGNLDRAAVVLRVVEAGEEEDRLQLVDLDPKRLQAVQAPAVLWKGGGGRTMLAAAPNGAYLAAAGNRDHRIAVYSFADLRKDRGQARQVLQSAGTTFRFASFVSKENRLGLLLSETAEEKLGIASRLPQPADVVFDLANRRVSGEAKAWKPAAASADGWRVQVNRPAKEPISLSVLQGEEPFGQVKLKPSHTLTAYALVPPKPLPTPLLAVAALDEFRQPLLLLYNARTGDLVRQLTGHLAVIRSLAASADGKLLVSAAEDQTVCVWGLANLDRHVGQRGALPGLAVREKDGTLTVERVFDDSPAKGKLQSGDAIESVIEAGKPRPLATLADFLEALALQKPGQKLTLRVRTAQERRDVVLEAGQAVDERKPLFSLFITRGGKGEERDWLGWSPLGPYDSSGPRAEQYLGWHRNTGEPKQPVSFALADQYRKDYLRRGILKHLSARGSLGPALEAWEKEQAALPPPALTLTLTALSDGQPAPRLDGRALVRGPRQTLRLAIDDFDLDRIAAAEWQFDGGPLQGFAPSPGRERAADLSKLPWQRGLHKVRVAVRTGELKPRRFEEELVVQYQPPAPVVTSKLPARLEVDKSEFLFEAEVKSLAGQDVQVRVQHKNRDKDLPVPQPQAPTIRQKIELKPGDNLIELAAVNKGALKDFEDLETAWLAVWVRYRLKAPQITVEKLVTLPAADEVVLEPGRPVIVDQPRVRIFGTVTATEKLDRLEWSRGTGKGQALARFAAGQQAQWPIAEEIPLELGPQRIRFRAQTVVSDEAETAVTIDYRPALPLLALDAPAAGPILYEGKNSREIVLHGRLVFPTDRRPFQATILVNDRELDSRPTIDEKERILTARLPLQPGENRIQVRLFNEWKASRTETLQLRLSYRRPPRIIQLDPPAIGPKPLVDVVARVESADDLPPTEAELIVKSLVSGEERVRRLPADAFQLERKSPPLAVWKLTARDVPLEPGETEIRLLASNRDDWSLEPAVLKLAFTPKPPARAEVSFLDPRGDTTVAAPTYPLRFQVRSASPLRKVELLRGQQIVAELNVDQLKAGPDGVFEVKEERALALLPGANPVQVRAVNDGGESASEPITLSYTYTPVRVFIDRLERRDRPGEFLVPLKRENNRLVFPSPAPDARLWAHGRVVWLDEGDRRLKEKETRIRARVNGFQQPAAVLEPAVGRERAFRAELLLGQANDNLVELLLPGLQQEAGDRPVFRINCLKPEKGQRLHLLLVSLRETDEQRLKRRALEALQATPISASEFKSPAFAWGRVYGPLTGDLSRKEVFYQLCDIQNTIEVLSRRGSPNDVVMVYYEGGESATAAGPGLWTSLDPKRRPAPLQRGSLVGFFAETQGAHLLMLDVVRDPAAASASAALPPWPAESHLGVLRYLHKEISTGSADARLLPALEQALPRSHTLKELADQLRQQTALLAKKYPDLVRYDPLVPPALERLELRR